MVSSKGLSFGSRGNWKERTRKKLTRKKHVSRVEIARESLCYSLYLLNPVRFSFYETFCMYLLRSFDVFGAHVLCLG